MGCLEGQEPCTSDAPSAGTIGLTLLPRSVILYPERETSVVIVNANTLALDAQVQASTTEQLCWLTMGTALPTMQLF